MPISAILLDQFFVGSALNDSPTFHDVDDISVSNRREAMCHRDDGRGIDTGRDQVHRLLNFSLTLIVQCTGGL